MDKMAGKLRQIIVDVRDLSVTEQLKLWSVLWDFADKQLPSGKELKCYTLKQNSVQKHWRTDERVS